ncbi:hypothetical protein ACRAWF_45060 [Streptomyces sp. L7]
MRTGIGAGVVAVLLAAGAGLWTAFAGEGHPFGDARASEGSDLPLRAVLDVVRPPLPAGAKDVHYVTHSPAASGQVSPAVAFRVSGAAMDRYLRANGIVPAEVDRLTNGPYATGGLRRRPGESGAVRRGEADLRALRAGRQAGDRSGREPPCARLRRRAARRVRHSPGHHRRPAHPGPKTAHPEHAGGAPAP